jgi:hypothetical protein
MNVTADVGADSEPFVGGVGAEIVASLEGVGFVGLCLVLLVLLWSVYKCNSSTAPSSSRRRRISDDRISFLPI